MRTAFLLALLICFGGGCGGAATPETNPTGDHDAGPDGCVGVNLDGGGAPATPPDGPSKCPQGICNYQTGAGCSGAMPACVPSVNGGTVVPACTTAGAGVSGSACKQTTECAAGYFCAAGACHKLCCGGDWTGCPSANEHCITTLSFSDGMGGVIPTGAMLCYPVNTCDPLMPASCPDPGTACLLVDPTGATACFKPGTGGSGDPCPCMGGFTCVVGGSGPTCRRLCKTVPCGEPGCQAGEGVCVHFTRDPPGVGECTPGFF